MGMNETRITELNIRASKFSASTTASEVLDGFDLRGKVIIVTGANSGCGVETARSLANHGAKVIMACRNLDAANEAIDRIKRANPYAKLLALYVDLADLRSVESFASKFLQLNLPLHVLICNAGIGFISHQLTKDGFETIFQVNYLGHVYLTQLLEDKLMESGPSRIVYLSSVAHFWSGISKENVSADFLSPKKPSFFTFPQYGTAKAGLNLMARYFSKRLADKNVTAYSVHPGGVNSPLARRLFYPIPTKIVDFVLNLLFKNPEQGAATSVYCAVYPGIENLAGSYFDNCRVAIQSSVVEDDELAEKLWNVTQEMFAEWRSRQ